MTDIDGGKPQSKPVSLEKFREMWQRKLCLHKDVPASVLKVVMVLGWHINRKSGQAFPGMRTIAKLANLSTSTVNKAVKWLHKHGHLDVEPGRTRIAANRYTPLLKRSDDATVTPTRRQHDADGDAGANRVFASERTGCSPQGATEPLKEPLKEPLSHSAPTDVGDTKNGSVGEGSEEDFRDRAMMERPSSIESPPSLEAQCYAEARGIPDPERSASIVARALKIDFWDPAAALEIIREVRESGGDSWELAHALWTPE